MKFTHGNRHMISYFSSTFHWYNQFLYLNTFKIMTFVRYEPLQKSLGVLLGQLGPKEPPPRVLTNYILIPF